MNYEEIIMNIIAHSGTSRSLSMEAIKEARNRNFDKSYELLKNSNKEFLAAHNVQTSLIQKEIEGERSEISLLMVHAQDHLMNCLTIKELAEEFINIYKKISEEN